MAVAALVVRSAVGATGASHVAWVTLQFLQIAAAVYVALALARSRHTVLPAADMRVDALTGLLNLRGFSTLAERVIRQARRYSRVFTILMIDIRMRDTASDDVATSVMQEVARAVLATCRDADVLIRYADHQFVMLLPETAIEGAQEVAGRVLQRAEHALASTRHASGSTVTVGIACYPEHGGELKALLDRVEGAIRSRADNGSSAVVVADAPSLQAA